MIACVLMLVLLFIKVSFTETDCSLQKLTNVEILSRGSNQSESFVWAEGIPNITITFLIKFPCNDTKKDFKLYLVNRPENNSKLLGNIFTDAFRQENHGFAFNHIQCLNNTTILQLPFLKASFLNEKRFEIRSYQEESKDCYYSPFISIQKCRKAGLISTKSEGVYGQKARMKCNNSVFVNQSNERVLGRTQSAVCGQDAKWKYPNYHCWDGQFLDLNDRNPQKTFKTGTKVLVFCDRLNSSVEEVKITSINLHTTNGTKMTWLFFNVSQKYNQDIVTCQQLFANNTIIETKFKLNILFPPVFERKEISKSFKMKRNNFVAIGFQASLLEKVSVNIFPPASNIRTFVEINNNSESFVFLHFEKVTKDNIRSYNISIKSDLQFNTTDVITLTVTSEEEQSRGDLSVAVAVLSFFVVVLFVIVVIGGFMYYRKFAKDTKPHNHNSVSLTYQPSNGLGRSLTRPETSNPERENAYNFATEDHDLGENTREDVYSTIYNNH